MSAVPQNFPRSNHYVLLIHGIRTDAPWMHELKALLETHGFKVEIPNYGYFDAFRFLWPGMAFKTRVINVILQSYRGIKDVDSNARVSVIAHSFGSYAVSKILLNEQDVYLHKVIFCGGIIKRDFPWFLMEKRCQRILNDYSNLDIWPLLAEKVTTAYGSSGLLGFTRAGRNLRERHNPNYLHSDYLNQNYAETCWLPFLTRSHIAASLTKKPGRVSEVYRKLIKGFQFAPIKVAATFLALFWIASLHGSILEDDSQNLLRKAESAFLRGDHNEAYDAYSRLVALSEKNGDKAMEARGLIGVLDSKTLSNDAFDANLVETIQQKLPTASDDDSLRARGLGRILWYHVEHGQNSRLDDFLTRHFDISLGEVSGMNCENDLREENPDLPIEAALWLYTGAHCVDKVKASLSAVENSSELNQYAKLTAKLKASVIHGFDGRSATMDRVIDQTSASEYPLLHALALSERARIKSYHDQVRGALTDLSKADRIYNKLSKLTGKLKVLSDRAYILLNTGRWKEAEHGLVTGESIAEILEDRGNHGILGRYNYVKGVMMREKTALRASKQALEKAMRHYKNIDADRYIRLVTIELAAIALLERKKVEDFIENVEQSLRDAEELEAEHDVAPLDIIKIRNAIASESNNIDREGNTYELTEFVEISEQFLTVSKDMPDKNKAILKMLEGDIMFVQGDFRVAGSKYVQASTFLDEDVDVRSSKELALRKAAVYVRSGRSAQATTHIDKAERLSEQLGSEFGRAQVELMKACLALDYYERATEKRDHTAQYIENRKEAIKLLGALELVAIQEMVSNSRISGDGRTVCDQMRVWLFGYFF